MRKHFGQPLLYCRVKKLDDRVSRAKAADDLSAAFVLLF